jgi:DNA repair exonuclease SbcCD ATPase subunit
MKRNKLFALILAVVFGLSTLGYAQDATTTSPDPSSQTLDEQFEHIKSTSNSWEDYKVIKKYRLNDFWKVVQDSVSAHQTEILQAQLKIGEQQTEIAELQNKQKELEKALAENEYMISHINVLGINFEKNTYVYINFGIIAALLLVMGIGYIRYNKSNKLAAEKKKNFDKLEEEFFNFKQTAREREAKIKREMQTEMNRAEELKRKLTAVQKSA